MDLDVDETKKLFFCDDEFWRELRSCQAAAPPCSGECLTAKSMAAFAALKHACVGGSDPRVESRDGA